MENNIKHILVKGSAFTLLALCVHAHALDFEVYDTKVKAFGYAKLDLIYDLNDDLGNAATKSNIRLKGDNGADGHFNAHAFQSRLGFSTATPTVSGDLVTHIEGDFWGQGGGSFRLRHAYGSWNGILAGQTTSNFASFLGFTPTVDFNGPIGQSNISRQGQLRYTHKNLSVAVEDSDNLGSTAVPSLDYTKSRHRLPDFTARYQSRIDSLEYAASVVLREVGLYNAIADKDKKAFGYGLGLHAKLHLSENVSLQSSLMYGDGIGGYIYLAPARSAYYDLGSNKVKTIKALGGTLGVSVKAGPGAFNVSYGLGKVDWDDAKAAGAVTSVSQDKKHQSLFANYIWSPVKNVQYGMEVSHHTRKNIYGDDGSGTRLQGMIQYNF
ncbi:MAG: DcaP family trimeric outer membrane transporter [Pseudomonas sp.]|nr:DcaP family trimeric outer membrane transporter [Pseudomonas sp.]